MQRGGDPEKNQKEMLELKKKRCNRNEEMLLTGLLVDWTQLRKNNPEPGARATESSNARTQREERLKKTENMISKEEEKEEKKRRNN